MKERLRWYTTVLSVAALTLFSLGMFSLAVAAPVPGGTLDPLTIPKYVTPLVIPPEMPKSTASPAPAADYDIAVRQFRQQILPGGIWGTTFPNPTGVGTVGPFPATTIWSYGRAADPLPDSSAIGGGAGIAPAPNSSFNYPAFTIENSSALATTVRWINDLKDPTTGNFLPHLFSVDQTLHWANPPTANCVMMPDNRTDCETAVAAPYTGPIPLVTHLHGAHVQPHSDGYPEAWWLPAANNIPAGYSLRGTHFGQADTTNTVPGSAFFNYENTQPATTLWYHDHALGMTRLNVYAGPAGFWLIRGGVNDLAAGILPGPAPTVNGGDPNFNATVRSGIREIPLVIQDRSFNLDGSLFYPADRTFFDGFTGPFIGGTGTPAGPSDISPIWNPEAFFNTMVVNGTTWPKFDVAPARYRLRLLDGCNSRTLNLSMFTVTSVGADGVPGTADDVLGAEVPFYQIGAEQGFLPKVVKIVTGFTTTLPGDGTAGTAVAAPDPAQALLMGPAERADVIVDFSGMANGTRVRMVNTGPDSPFGGFPAPAADPLSSGQVMDFIVNTTLTKPTDANTTPPQTLVLPAEAPLGAATNTRQVSLNELSSDQVCVEVNIIDGAIIGTLFSTFAGDPNFLANCAAAVVAPGNFPTPMGPRQAQLGVLATDALGNVTAVAKRWSDPITETPALNSTEVWEIFNTTADAHPIHVHLVAFQVVDRQLLDPAALALGNLVPSGAPIPPNPNELGYKDTVISYPGQITRIKAKFDIAGLYVWHCHIVEHEDNEMMRSFVVTTPATAVTVTPSVASPQAPGTPITFTATGQGGTGPYEYRFWLNDGSGAGFVIQRDYSNVNTWTWTPAVAGNYDIFVEVRVAGSTVLRDAYTTLYYYEVTPISVSLSANVASPQEPGTPITFTATGQGGSGPFEYRFWLNDGSGTGFVMQQNYSTVNTWTWTPATAGNYDVLVETRRVGSTAVREASNYIFFYQVTSISVELSANVASPQPAGTPITFTATGQGGTGPFEYRFWLNDGSGAGFVMQQDYSTVNTWTWTPAAVGNYDVFVETRRVGSPLLREAYNLIFYYQIN